MSIRIKVQVSLDLLTKGTIPGWRRFFLVCKIRILKIDIDLCNKVRRRNLTIQIRSAQILRHLAPVTISYYIKLKPGFSNGADFVYIVVTPQLIAVVEDFI